jgi:hypothetical protein
MLAGAVMKTGNLFSGIERHIRTAKIMTVLALSVGFSFIQAMGAIQPPTLQSSFKDYAPNSAYDMAPWLTELVGTHNLNPLSPFPAPGPDKVVFLWSGGKKTESYVSQSYSAASLGDGAKFSLVPESTTMIAGAFAFIPLAVSLLRAMRRKCQA